jgi:hypothetical protein
MSAHAAPEVTVECPFCYQRFVTWIDWSESAHQTLDIDCEVCCRALVLHVSWDADLEEATCMTEKAF